MQAFLSFISRFDDTVPIDNGDGQPINDSQKELVKEMRQRLKHVLQPIHSDRFLVRYLAAQNYDLDKGTEMARKHLQWREEMGADRPIPELIATVPESVRKYTPPPVFAGEDRDGFPVAFDFPGHLDAAGICKACRVEDVARYHGMVFMEQVYDKLRQQSEKHNRLIDKFIVVQDMTGWSLRSMQKPLINMVMETTHLRNANYPQILRKMIIINPPTIIGMCWSLVKPFLRERTRRKIMIVRGKPSQFLSEFMDESQLPRMYGGLAPDPSMPPSKVPEDAYLANQMTDDMDTLTIPRGQAHKFEYQLHKGDSLSWIFQTASKDIGFGVHYRAASGAIESVVPVERKQAHTVPDVGQVTCKKDGTYLVIFDNSHSMFTSKTVKYSITTAAPEQEPVPTDLHPKSHSTAHQASSASSSSSKPSSSATAAAHEGRSGGDGSSSPAVEVVGDVVGYLAIV